MDTTLKTWQRNTTGLQPRTGKRNKKYKNIPIDHVEELFNFSGLTAKEIARFYDISHRTVEYWIARYGMKNKKFLNTHCRKDRLLIMTDTMIELRFTKEYD